jgi:hypothetical protein
MMDSRWLTLKEILLDNGWEWKDDSLYAPHQTMWFATSSERPNFAQFRDRLTEAAATTADIEDEEVDQVALHADLVSLVAALDVILDGN